MKNIIVKLISEAEYNSDKVSVKLFQDQHSFSFCQINFNNINLKFAWNSKDINPNVKYLKDLNLLFIGVDSYVVGYNCINRLVVFCISTDTNFKWFDLTKRGIAIVTETDILLINTTSNKCIIANCFCYSDIIIGTEINGDSMSISFLAGSQKLIAI